MVVVEVKVLERAHLPKIFICILAVILLVISTIFNLPQSNNNHRNRLKRSIVEQTVCKSASCVDRWNAMVSSMDLSANPCQDFYQYACGGWIRNSQSPTMKSYDWTKYALKLELPYSDLKKILEQPTAESSEAGKNAIRYYQSCLEIGKTQHETDTLSRKSLQELLDLIGGWPVIDEISNSSYLRKKWDFQETFELIHNALRVDVFFRWEVELDRSLKKNYTIDPWRYELKVQHDEASTTSSSFYPNGTATPDFISQVKEVVSFLLNSNSSIFTDQNELLLIGSVEDIVEVESRIYQIFKNLRPIDYVDEKSTIAYLQSSSPFVNWEKIFKSAFSQFNINITSSRSVFVSSHRYLQNISTLVQELIATERGQLKLKNFLSWQVAKSLFATIKTRWNSYVAGAENNKCIDFTVDKMNLAVSSMYLRRSVDSETKKRLTEAITKFIQGALKENINRLKWLDDDTRTSIKDKIDAITNLIGYPEFLLNITEVDTFYKGLEIKSDEYFMNNVRLKKFDFLKQLTKLDRQDDKTEWNIFISTGAFYLPNGNQVFVPSLIYLLQSFFDATFLPAFNFGSIGFIIGHETAHGFEMKGLEFDRDGQQKQWLNDTTIQRLNKNSECLIKQYSSYNVNGDNINGTHTLNENIADNVGLKITFDAFMKWGNGGSATNFFLLPFQMPYFLPFYWPTGYHMVPVGMSMTDQQLFFLSFAQVFCSKENKINPLEDIHSHPRYRVIGSLSNLPEFSSAFQCPTGSFMNPAEKCQFW